MAVYEYLKNHPYIQSDGQKINITVKPSLTREQIEAMVKSLIREHMAGIEPAVVKSAVLNTVEIPEESGIDIMIKNLDMFAI